MSVRSEQWPRTEISQPQKGLAGQQKSGSFSWFQAPFLSSPVTRFSTTSIIVYFTEPSLDTPSFLRSLMASTISATVQTQQMAQKIFQFQRDRTPFLSFTGTVKDGTLRELGSQKLWQRLGLPLGLHRLHEADDGVHDMFRDIFIPQLPHFCYLPRQYYIARRGKLFIPIPFRFLSSSPFFQGQTSILEHLGCPLLPIS